MLNLYNTLSRRKEAFRSSSEAVKLFVCGPTVYDYLHLGHARTYVAFDVLTRYLKFLGFRVRYLMNITDVADRIVDRAAQIQKDPLALAGEYEAACLEDLSALGIASIDEFARASDHVPEIVEQVKGLIGRGAAYETNTGVYFEVSKFPRFGRLSGLDSEELGLRRLELCSSKKRPEDFSLWRKHDRDTLGWESPWGYGRPGWHVEDTAISMMRFGDTYDIHGGASELIFPHHEAEIAQAETLTGKSPFVRYWMHTGLLNVNGRKMSKSLGNVVRIRDALKEFTAADLRYYLLSFHYRQSMIMSRSGLERARSKRRQFVKNLTTLGGVEIAKGSKKSLDAFVNKVENDFKRHMNNDLDTPRALKVLHDASSKLAKRVARGGGITMESKTNAENRFRAMASVFGILD